MQLQIYVDILYAHICICRDAECRGDAVDLWLRLSVLYSMFLCLSFTSHIPKSQPICPSPIGLSHTMWTREEEAADLGTTLAN